METMSLLPSKLPQKLVEGDGGSYFAWNDAVFPYLAQGNVSAGYFILNPRGFALPHYADCNKIAYVIEGTNGVTGLIYPETTEEKVVKLEKGDTIFIPNGVASWWFNAGHDELKIIFLGETYNANNPGTFTYYILVGAMGVIKGFSAETISKAYGLTKEQANELSNSQKEPFLITIAKDTIMPKPSKNEDVTINLESISPDISVESGGSMTTLTSENYPALKGSQISGKLLRLEPNAMIGPCYYGTNSGVELNYVTKGSGWVQIVGMNGKIALDTKLEVGQLFALPKYYVVALGAGNEGIECFSIITTSRPVLGDLAGKKSLWKAMSPQVVQVSLNVNPELQKLLMENINKTTIITRERLHIHQVYVVLPYTKPLAQ